MKKILFVIHRLHAGGAEKSLVSLLNSLPTDTYDVDLISMDFSGMFCSQIPSYVKLIEAPKELICQYESIRRKRFWYKANFKILIVKIYCILFNFFFGKKCRKEKSHIQLYNEVWRRFIPDSPKEYDVAISYIDGLNYYVIDHVRASRKILWCHNDYNKLDLVPTYDYNYYEKAYKICTISELCRKSLIDNFPKLQKKIEVIENISSPKLILAQSENLKEMENTKDCFIEDSRFKIVSIGRLTEQKGFDIAIEAAKDLKTKGCIFCWYIIGDGPLSKNLKLLISENGVDDCVKLLGIRTNPYSYIYKSDLYVMPSRYEGKSIALDEAKILCKPIVVTNYPSVGDAIENNKNGLIVDINPQSIAEGILKLYNDVNLRRSFVQNLKVDSRDNTKNVVDKFMNLLK